MPKNVRLLRLSLTNYRNIEHLELDFSGENSSIVGENHIGKTNALESLFVLLDDALMSGASNLPSIKPLADTKRVVSIEAAFDVDGEEFTVRKDYGEEWVRARGTDELSMKGHFQKLYIQGTKVERTKDFYSQIRAKFGIQEDPDKIDLIRLLLSPTYLGEMGEGKDWTALRAFIIKLVGDVSDDDVFAKNPELSIIRADLKSQSGSIEQLKKKYKQECDGLEATILQGEAVVSSLEKTEKPTDEAISIARRAIDEHDEAIAKLRANSGSDVESERIQRELTEAQSQLIEEQRRANKSKSDPNEARREELRTKYAEARSQLSDATIKKSTAQSEIAAEEQAIARLQRERETVSESVNEPLIDRIRELDATKIEVSETCPTCGQRLPEDKIEAAVQAERQRIAAERASLVERCKANKARRAEIDEAIVSSKSRIASLQDEVDELLKKIDTSREAMESITKQANEIPVAAPRQETALEASLRAKVEELGQKLKESRAAFQSGLQDVNAAIVEHQEAKKPFQSTLDDLAYYQRQQERLATERETLAANRKKLAEAEQKKECAAQFLYAKLRMLDENVAKVFGNIRIKLIQENINGGFDPVCKPYIFDSVKGESTQVSWAAGSKSEKVETGIAICECVKKALGLPDLPFIFDEGGEISSETFATRLGTGSQIICVKVRDGIATPMVMPL